MKWHGTGVEVTAEMSDAEIVAVAITRWGLSEPTADDVLTMKYPDYVTNPRHMLRWHDLADEVFRACVASEECVVCGSEIPPINGTGNKRRKFCSRLCQLEGETEQAMEKYEPKKGKPRVTQAMREQMTGLFVKVSEDL